MTELALQKGDAVVATLRKPEVLAELSAKYPAEKLLVLKLDVSNQGEVVNAFAEALKHFGRIDIVFNNAGCAVLGELEAIDDASARALFEVNLWAAVNVTKEAVRVFREVNKPAGGRLLQNTSLSGLLGYQGLSIYCASKFALEGLSEAVAAELDPQWNIKVTLIEPGAFRTNILLMSNTPVMSPHPAYVHSKSPVNALREYIKEGLPAADARKGVEVIYKVAQLQDPPLHFPLGKDCVAAVRRKIAALQANTDKYEAWSDGLDNVQ